MTLARYVVTYAAANGFEVFIVKAESSMQAIDLAREARPGTRSRRWWRARKLLTPITFIGPITTRLKVA